MADQRRPDQIQLVRNADRALAIDDNFAFALHRTQATGEECPFIVTNIEQTPQFFCSHGRPLFLEDFEQKLPTGQRVIVLLLFPIQVRILLAQ